ncbi:MAG: YcxB family protein [Hyphomicrobiaceae bacterium]|nr:YcxB family protein [Hyphomicrobiaceae bacterium]
MTKWRRIGRILHLVIDVLMVAAMIGFAWVGDWAMAIYFAVVALLVISLDLVVAPWQVRRQFVHQRIGEFEIEFSADEEGFSTHSELGGGRTFWPAIRQVDETPEHIMLWPSNRIGYIVPKRAFASPEDAAAFVALAKEKTADQKL